MGARPLAMPLPVWVIGSYSNDGTANLMTVAWCGQCSSDPPCVAVSVRKSRLTYENLLSRQAFTVNIASRRYLTETDFFGLTSGRQVDKFKRSGLTPVRSLLVDAPYVAEFPLALECKVITTVEIGSHTQVIGEIIDMKVDQAALDSENRIVIEQLEPFYCSPDDRRYRGLGAALGAAYADGCCLLQPQTGE